MRGILINADERTVTAVDVNPDPNESLNGMRELIKCEFVEAFCFTYNLTIWIDEEGKLKLPKAGFKVDVYPVEFAGNGLLLGEDAEGNCVDCHVPVEIAEDGITWLSPEEVHEPEPPKVMSFDTAEEMMDALRKIRG